MEGSVQEVHRDLALVDVLALGVELEPSAMLEAIYEGLPNAPMTHCPIDDEVVRSRKDPLISRQLIVNRLEGGARDAASTHVDLANRMPERTLDASVALVDSGGVEPQCLVHAEG